MSASDSAEITLVASPDATFKKEGSVAGSGDPEAGDIVTYSFTIENTGNVTLTGIAIAEHLVGVGSVLFAEWPGAEGELAPGKSTTASAEYVLTQADVDAGEVVNVSTLSAVPTRGTLDDIEAQHSLSLASGAALTLVKSAVLYDDSGDGLANTDERIRYTFTLTNVGNVTLTNVTLQMPRCRGCLR
nr:hypothetical protein [Microbacterium sp. NC79]